MAVQAFFAELAATGSAPLAAWPLDDELWMFGLETVNGRVVPAGRRDSLEPTRIRQALSRRAGGWLQRLDVHPVIGSTSAELMTHAERESVDGWVCLAELQLQGRGRRGR